MRAWARENGYDVADRGRLRPEVLEAYAAAHRKGSGTAKKAAAKPAAAKKAAAKPAAAKKPAAKKAPAPKPAVAKAPEPEAEEAPASPEPKPKPVTDDRRLVALGEELAALTDRVAKLEAQVGTKNGKSSSKSSGKTPRFRRSK